MWTLQNTRSLRGAIHASLQKLYDDRRGTRDQMIAAMAVQSLVKRFKRQIERELESDADMQDVARALVLEALALMPGSLETETYQKLWEEIEESPDSILGLVKMAFRTFKPEEGYLP